MTEDFLHFIWRTRNFNFTHLTTTEGLQVEIVSFGQWNLYSGPDFTMAHLRIDGVAWIGNIEMHLCSSEWNRHGHTTDPAYENVILHVVLEDDAPVFAGKRKVVCVELKDRIDSKLLGQYLRLMANEAWVPCAAHLQSIPSITRDAWLDRMLVERLQYRIASINALLEQTQDDWTGVFYRCLASAYGFKINSTPFQRLAELVPLAHVYKHIDAPDQIAAMYYGVSGMLNRVFADEYPCMLQREFSHLSAKYGLNPIGAHVWKWGRLRPGNFPSLRIAQFVSLMETFPGLLRTILESSKLDTLQALFMTPVHPYWNTHSDFDKPSAYGLKQLGLVSAHGILINTVAPLLFCFGKRRSDEQYVDRALDLFTLLPPESNTITRHWSANHMPNLHAGHSQALIHLKRNYCDERKCVTCAIGNAILTSNSRHES